ncbi:MAG: D-alanine--D-alanine ligase [Alphaproteobacteria bacterium]|nr:D-alanine--D-alanine ligase [Alphaproteobacteria bacterium]
MMSKTVALLMGGWSPEREVSLSSGRECAKALADHGYRVKPIDVGRDLPALLHALVPRPDVVFNALHGVGGEDGTIQGVLDMLGIPYTHSGLRASALAMHKPTAKNLFRVAGLPVADDIVARPEDLLISDPMAAPFVVKPTNQGSTVGVRIVRQGDNAWREEVRDWCYGEEIMVERFVPGRELTVAVLGDRALGVCEIIPRSSSFYDYTAKYSPGGSEHLVPAPLPVRDYDLALDIALRAHVALGCRGISRADLRYDDTGDGECGLYLLEVNTQPGMTPTSLVPDIARHAGIGFDELVVWMVENAACEG